MEKLPKVLTQIETKNDDEKLTPIFREHKKKLAEYASDNNSVGVGLSELERRQRLVFIESRHQFNNECERNSYMGHILNNMGVGPGPVFQIADQV